VTTAPVLEFRDVSKDYRGLRPLRIEHLSILRGERVALVGFDQPMAEVFVNLATATTLPDRGEVKVFGQPTASIVDSAEWLTLVDRFGIVSERAVLLDSLTVQQNLAVPFTLEIEPPPDDVAEKAAGLASEVGLVEPEWTAAIASLDPSARVKVRLGRALAFDPALVMLEHVSAGMAASAAGDFARRLREISARRGAAVIALTADRAFAAAAADRVLTLDAATGRLSSGRRGWFGLRHG